MKKFLSILLTLSMCICSSVSAYNTNELSTEEPRVAMVYSKKFPNAYIIQNESVEKTRSASTTKTVSATVFVEEEYGLDANGNPITVSSRLLSEEEVLAIGLESFGDMEKIRQEATSKAAHTRSSTNARGALTISFSGTFTLEDTGVTCDLDGNASWSAGASLFNGENRPAVGTDFIGITWSGGYTCPYCSIDVAEPLNNYEPEVLTLCAATPNGGRVWEFTEAWAGSMLGQTATFYLTSIDVCATLRKNYLTGNGNTAEVILNYTHTYEEHDGSATINASTEETGYSYTVNNVDKQWSIVCVLTGIPY